MRRPRFRHVTLRFDVKTASCGVRESTELLRTAVTDGSASSSANQSAERGAAPARPRPSHIFPVRVRGAHSPSRCRSARACGSCWSDLEYENFHLCPSHIRSFFFTPPPHLFASFPHSWSLPAAPPGPADRSSTGSALWIWVFSEDLRMFRSRCATLASEDVFAR